eukprot:TRINITY_DN4765_c0_g1_i10.p1 TRINITY_DN4765_c0_g1~~TRINITY_DN4765_c0_g1_i10.p1  ORF type:complete len:235 (+),score=11.96 TRINITY_DN4765_c0_g1_i10:298-1002(+)
MLNKLHRSPKIWLPQALVTFALLGWLFFCLRNKNKTCLLIYVVCSITFGGAFFCVFVLVKISELVRLTEEPMPLIPPHNEAWYLRHDFFFGSSLALSVLVGVSSYFVQKVRKTIQECKKRILDQPRPTTLKSSLLEDQDIASSIGNPQEDDRKLDPGRLYIMDPEISRSLPISAMRKMSENGILNTPPDKKEGLMARFDHEYLTLKEDRSDSDYTKELSVNKSRAVSQNQVKLS